MRVLHSFLVLLLSLVSLFQSSAQAQEQRALDPARKMSQYVFETWSEDDGLPQTTVSSIVSTPDGYLWVGTQEGLVRYNGIEFHVFDKGNSPAFSEDHTIETMMVDSEGRLWIGLGQGVLVYEYGEFRNLRLEDGSTVKTVQSIIEREDGLITIATAMEGIYTVSDSVLVKDDFLSEIQENLVTAMLTDAAGDLWIGSDEALYRVRNRQVKRYSAEDGIPDGGSDLINSVYNDRQGQIWVGASGGGVTITPLHSDITPLSALDGMDIRANFEDAAGTHWIGTATKGIFRITAAGIESFTADGALSAQSILSLHVDHEGSLWIGTDGGGLARFRSGKFTTFTKNEGLPVNESWTVFEDSEEGIWIGSDGGGVTHLKDGNVTSYSTANGLSGDVISGLAETPDGTIWVATYGNGINRISKGRIKRYSVKDGLPDDEVTALYVDHSGRLWIGSNSGLATLEDGEFTTTSSEDGLVDNLITAIAEDQDGTMWIGTWSDGLSRITADGIDTITVDEGLPNDRVFSFHEDNDHVMWIGTYGGGIARYKDGKFDTISMKDGLFNDYIYTILESDDGMLWMTCNKGIFRVDKQMLNDKADGLIDRVTSEIFNRDDGLKGNEMNGGFQPAGWKGADGRLWFPSLRGVAMINPSDIRRNTTIPDVHVESFQVDGVDQNFATALTFSSSVEKLEFKFASLSFEAPDRNLYEHRLIGYDDEWARTDGQSATFTNLDPGEYEFNVRASNNDGIWNEEGYSISFNIKPRFFQTTWFLILSILIVLVNGVGIYRWRISKLNQRQAELERERDKARAANRFSSVVLDNLNHEFRTPLTVILGYTDVLMSELTGDAANFASDIKSHGNRLLHTLDSLLELGSIQKTGVDSELQAVDIHAVTTEIVLMHQATASAKNLVLYIADDPHPGSAMLPLDGVKYAIRATIDNALKFTDEGQVCISLGRKEDFIEVRIADTGIGVSRADKELIFEPFKQASEGLDRNHEGAGVGLTVARQFMRSMRGTLELESSGVDGSTFCLRFPAVGAIPGEAHPVYKASPGNSQLGVNQRAPIQQSSRLKTRLCSSDPASEKKE